MAEVTILLDKPKYYHISYSVPLCNFRSECLFLDCGAVWVM
jgi:hypothetical protein